MFDCRKSYGSAFSESKPWPVVAGFVSDLATLTIMTNVTNVVKTLINHPPNHHRWLVSTKKHGVAYKCFNPIVHDY